MERPRPTADEVRLIGNAQIHKTIRFFFGCALVGWLALQARIGIVEYAKKEPWESVMLGLFGLIATLAAPSVLLAMYGRFVGVFTARIISRLTKLEREKDPDRTSSHLNPDGTDPEEAHP